MLTSPSPLPPRDLLGILYSAATAAVAPGPALLSRLEGLTLRPDRKIWILALGKAAEPMAAAAMTHLKFRGIAPAGGLVVAPAPPEKPDLSLGYHTGNHPQPGSGSLAAAEALGEITNRISGADEVWLLLSGGTSSLIAAPEPGLTAAELHSIYSLLLGSGLDITDMNRVRKRFSRWGGGKLARALAPARVRGFIVSDVIGDDLASIGSGPCVPDPTTATQVRELLESAGLWNRIPDSARRLLLSVETGELSETPKPGDEAFARVSLELIVSNRLALEAAAAQARAMGLVAAVAGAPISGEAAGAGAVLADALLSYCSESRGGRGGRESASCFIWGGETTVTLGEDPPGLGGRCQELALSAAKRLDGSPARVALLAAGTDGRDGPTDAAGAIVDSRTWRAIAGAGRDPERDLVKHDAYNSLNAAGALLRPGLTGTNVMDVMIGICLG